MQRLILQIRQSEFLRHNAIFFIGSVAIGALNYVYYPVLGRLLDPVPFGEVQTLVALFLQLAIFLSVLSNLTVNIIANSDNQIAARKTMLELEKLALLVSLIGFVLAVFAAPLLQKFFNFDSFAPFIVLALAIVVSVPPVFRTAYLRGKKYFGLTSIVGLVAAAAKLFFSALFIYLGFGTVGAIAGLVLAQLASFVYASVKAKQLGFDQSLMRQLYKRPDMRLVVPELRYAGLVLVCSLTITALYSVDIVAVKHYFDAHTAGLYAGISTVARIIFFLTASIAQVLLPSVKISATASENQAALRKSAYLTCAIGGCALLAFWAMPQTIIHILMGQQYDMYATLLPRLGLVIFIVSLLNLVLLYFMALRRYAIAFVAFAGLLVTCGLVVANHGSLTAVVNSMLYGSLALAAMLLTWVVVDKTKNRSMGMGV